MQKPKNDKDRSFVSVQSRKVKTRLSMVVISSSVAPRSEIFLNHASASAQINLLLLVCVCAGAHLHINDIHYSAFATHFLHRAGPEFGHI